MGYLNIGNGQKYSSCPSRWILSSKGLNIKIGSEFWNFNDSSLQIPFEPLRPILTVEKVGNLFGNKPRKLRDIGEIENLGFRLYETNYSPLEGIRQGLSYDQVLDLDGKKTIFFLGKAGEPHFEPDKIPKHHVVFYDSANNRACIRGPQTSDSNSSHWVYAIEQEEEEITDPFEYLSRSVRETIGEASHTIKQIKIREPILLITEDGNIITKPMSKDESVYGFAGKRGSGKSTGLQSLVCQRFAYNPELMIAVLNDSLQEARGWSKPAKSPSFVKILDRFQVKPQGLPIMLLYPLTRDLRDDIIFKKNDIGLKFCITFDEWLKNYSDVFSNNPHWQMGESSKSLIDSVQRELVDCKTTQDIIGLIEKKLYPVPLVDSMKLSMAKVFENLFEEKITQESREECCFGRWSLTNTNKEILYTATPMEVCLKAGLIACLQTSYLNDDVIKSVLIGYYLKNLYNMMNLNKEFRDRRLLLVIDEVHDICKRKNQLFDGNRNIGSEMMSILVRKGRQIRTGMIWATQSPTDVEDIIYKNTDVLYNFQMLDDDAKTVVKGFGMSRSRIKDIKALEPHQCILSSRIPLKCYTQSGNETELPARRDVFGYVFPPYAHHLQPGEQI